MPRHEFDGLSFAFGILFVVAGLLLLSGGAEGVPMEWAGPLTAVGLGILVLVAARPRHQAPEDDGAGPSENARAARDEPS